MLDFHYHRVMSAKDEMIREGFNVAISLYNGCGFASQEMQILGANTALRAMAMAEFEHAGKQTYSVGPVMANVFANTKLDDINQTDYHSPYPCIYVKIPDGLRDEWVIHGGDSVGWLPIEGFYFINWKDMSDYMRERIGDEPHHHISSTIILTAKGPDSNPFDDADFRYNMPASGNPQEFIEDYLNRIEGWTKDVEGQQLPQPVVLRDMLRIAVNLCTYLDAENREVDCAECPDEAEIQRCLDRVNRTKPTKSHYKKYVTKLRRAEAQANVLEVGNNAEEVVKQAAERTGMRVEEFLRVRHTVGGHKQRYWYGAKSSPERRRKWKWKIGYVRCEDNSPTSGEPSREYYELD